MNNFDRPSSHSSEHQTPPTWEQNARVFVATIELRPDNKRQFHALFIDPQDQRAVLELIERARQDMDCEREPLIVTPYNISQVINLAVSPADSHTPIRVQRLHEYSEDTTPPTDMPREWGASESIIITLPSPEDSSDTQATTYAEIFDAFNRNRDRLVYGDGPLVTIVAPLESMDEFRHQQDIASTFVPTIFASSR